MVRRAISFSIVRADSWCLSLLLCLTKNPHRTRSHSKLLVHANLSDEVTIVELACQKLPVCLNDFTHLCACLAYKLDPESAHAPGQQVPYQVGRTLGLGVENRVSAAHIYYHWVFQPEVISQADPIGVARSATTPNITPRTQLVSVNAVLSVKRRYVVVQRDNHSVRRNDIHQREQLCRIEVVRHSDVIEA